VQGSRFAPNFRNVDVVDFVGDLCWVEFLDFCAEPAPQAPKAHICHALVILAILVRDLLIMAALSSS
jgi:hypothetical protein